MTNEEAIKELKYIKKQTGYADAALDMAIKALEQQNFKGKTNREVLKALFGKFFSIPNGLTNEWLDALYQPYKESDNNENESIWNI